MMTIQITAPTTCARPAKVWLSPLRYLRDALAAVDAAHEAHRKIKALPDGIEGDTGMSREEILGVKSRQEALPFFMQPRTDC